MHSRNIKIILVSVFGLVLVSACGMETVSAANPTDQVSASQPANTHVTVPPANSPTPTPTATNTWIPSNTPTIGPPPDLELVNVSIYPNGDPSIEYTNYFFFGRVRNNTTQIMIFNYDFVPFRFRFDRWGYDPGMEKYYNEIYKDAPVMRYDPDHNRLMNCFLYPGDEGVIVLKTPSQYSERIDYNLVPQHDGPLGIWYTYESFYEIQPDLRQDWHPKAENLVFSVANNTLIFDYDIYVPVSEIGVFAHLKSWTLLFDKNGKIINVLYKNLENLGGMTGGKNYHVHGTTETPISDRMHYFIPTIDLTPEMIEKVDHIEIFAEEEDGNTCRKYK
jgi:hypothetical protein